MSKAKKKQARNVDAAALDGLEDLLDKGHVEAVAAESVAEDDEQPIQTVLNLLEQLVAAADMVKETRQRLNEADERMFSLANQVTEQERLLGRLSYYKGEADKVPALELELARVKAELDHLKAHPFRRIFGLK